MGHTNDLPTSRPSRWGARSGAVLAAVTLLLGTALSATAASAERGVVPDRGGSRDARGVGEVSSVRVEHRPRVLEVTLRSAPRTDLADFSFVWTDSTRRGDSPQRVAYWRTIYGRDRVARLLDTRRRAIVSEQDPAPRCWVGRDYTAKGPDGPWLRLSIPTRCLPPGERVRVSVATAQEYGFNDWAPARRAWSRWFDRG
ncbi:hypothetical protein [Nocardioides sp. CFH 31398]|uniref:hypothetical protein n=1 Tax=Nocardioides sp. CFH 31398 TaxID=2919579 RepID=UPI001F07052E|nr:hypothetical protein [Nocardioides sp. CFH 31398]MCH1866462.1 hypothetical protein [Nocardioides sp. CFH 31398]